MLHTEVAVQLPWMRTCYTAAANTVTLLITSHLLQATMEFLLLL